MTLLSYQVFQAVVEQGSFRKAAQVLNLTPSAVSHAITSMEQELGFTIFTRSKSGISLTNYGETLQPYINAVLNSEESLNQAVSKLNGLQQGVVKVGCFSSVCTNWMTDIIESFQVKYPGISLEVYQGTYADVSHWIKTGIVWDFSHCPVQKISPSNHCTETRCFALCRRDFRRTDPAKA